MKDKIEKKFLDGFKMAQTKHAETPVGELLSKVIPTSHGISARMFGWNAGLRVLRNERLAHDGYKVFLATARRKLAKQDEKDAELREKMK